MAHRSLAWTTTRSFCALLALVSSACGSGGGSDAQIPTYSGAPPGSVAAQPAATGPGSGANEAESAANASGSADRTGTEGQTGDLPLTAGGNANASAQNGGAAQSTDTQNADPTASNDGAMPANGDMATNTDPAQPAAPQPTLERPTKGTTDLFPQIVGVSEGEVDAKLTTAVNRYFGIGTNEPATPTLNTGYRVYYELPQDGSMAFIWAADSNDIRSEGMSYGMMIAVQMDMQPQFDRLWKFAKTYMQFPANSNIATWRYYFRWQGSVNTGNAQNWAVNYGANTGPAPDGDQYFAAALYLAARRWGNGNGTNYKQEADNIAHAMISNQAAGGNTPLFQQNLPVFYPSGGSAGYTDPSYNLPAFYELFALDGPQADSARWLQIASTARNLLVSSANAQTGLHPDYANFNGTPNSGGSDHDQFHYDAWRVVMNMAVDYSWFSQDARLKTQVEKYHNFFGSHLSNNNVDNALFALNGTNPSGGSSTALTSTLGSGALASDASNKGAFVTAAWNVGQQSGQYRYYQESVYLLGLLATSGMYGYEWNGNTQ